MNENRRYEVRGSMALAAREERTGSHNVIDYDIARRSYEARQRLARRQANLHQAGYADPRQMGIASTSRRSLQKMVEDSYTPQRNIFEVASDMGNQLRKAILSHPFVEQLKYGSLSGRPMQGATYRQVMSTTVVCVAISSVMVFVGA